jgi:hypothetical protein
VEPIGLLETSLSNQTKTDMKSTLIIQIFMAIGAFLIVPSCTYDEVLPYEPDPTVEVFFTQDIVPIFNSSCNGAGCHNGSVAPDLRPENAYDALWTGGFINVEIPEESELYLWDDRSKRTNASPWDKRH